MISISRTISHSARWMGMGQARTRTSSESLPELEMEGTSPSVERWPSWYLGRLAVVLVTSLVILPLLAVISGRAPWVPSVDGIGGFFSGKEACEVKSTTGGGLGGSVDFSNIRKDKLLGGLLAAGIDEASCLSRYQSVLYRKASPYFPSPYLLERLRKYEALHKRCGPSTELYNRSVGQLKSGHSNGTMECNYVVWIYCSGLGNRILTIASAFLYALLTNRVLLIEKNADMGDLFCEPFPETSWLLPPDFPLFPFQDFNAQCSRSYGNMLKNNVISNDLNGVSAKPLPAYIYLHLAHDYTDFDKRFFCDEDQLFLEKIPWLVLLSNNYFLPSFFEMPAYEEELSRLFPKKDTVFHHLGRYLFHPTNVVWGLITRYYLGYLAKADERLGIQVRVFETSNGPLQHVGDQILACTLQEKLLPNTTLEETVLPTTHVTRAKAVLITSLSSGYYDRIRDRYWERPAANGETVTVYQPSHEETQQLGKTTHEMKALAEIYLLSMTDTLVTSAMSTFGYVALGLGGLKPWIMLKPENHKVPDPPCRQLMSMEPCFHAPPYYDCKAKKVDSAKVLAPHLGHCEDLSSGLKLFESKE